jgi:hypothetical protein
MTAPKKPEKKAITIGEWIKGLLKPIAPNPRISSGNVNTRIGLAESERGEKNEKQKKKKTGNK